MKDTQPGENPGSERRAFGAALWEEFPVGALPSGLVFLSAALLRFFDNMAAGHMPAAAACLAAAVSAVVLLLLLLYPPARRWGLAAALLLFYAGFLGFCLGEARAHATTYLYYSMLVGTVCIPFPSPYWLLPVPLCMAVLVWQGGGSASPVLLLTATVAALSGAYLHHRRGKAFFLSRLRLERLSERDELTGLYNRRGLGKQAEQLWKACREMGCPAHVLMVDIDDFKSYNDTYGHIQGDKCLRAIARTIYAEDKSLRPGRQIVARYGGEEFLVVSTNPDFAVYAEKLVCVIRSLTFPCADGETSFVTISAGLYSGSPGVDGGIEAFIEKADEALYLAKKQGKNQLAVYASGTDGRLQTQTGAAHF